MKCQKSVLEREKILDPSQNVISSSLARAPPLQHVSCAQKTLTSLAEVRILPCGESR